MNNDENLDLLKLEEPEIPIDSLPDAEPFMSPKSKRPLVLWGILLVVILLAVYIIVCALAEKESSSIEVDLDSPVTTELPEGGVDGAVSPIVFEAAPVENIEIQEKSEVMGQVVPVNLAPTPVEQPVKEEVRTPVQETVGMPVRIVEDRREIKFDSSKHNVEARSSLRKQPSRKMDRNQHRVKDVKKSVATKSSNWYVQFGSYSSRVAAESAERQIKRAHADLLAGKQFVILAAVLPNGNTTYRLRIGFVSSDEANGYCRNAKSDGLDCYVAK